MPRALIYAMKTLFVQTIMVLTHARVTKDLLEMEQVVQVRINIIYLISLIKTLYGNITLLCGSSACAFLLFCNDIFSSSPDIDECLLDPSSCDANAFCTNSRGSYSCDCKRGFTGNGTICEGMLSILRFGCFCRM